MPPQTVISPPRSQLLADTVEEPGGMLVSPLVHQLELDQEANLIPQHLQVRVGPLQRFYLLPGITRPDQLLQESVDARLQAIPQRELVAPGELLQPWNQPDHQIVAPLND